MDTDPFAHEDYRPAAPSERHAEADRLARWLYGRGLTRLDSARRDASGRFYEVLVASTGGFGRVHLFGTEYIHVSLRPSWQGMPESISRIYGCVEDALVAVSLALEVGDMASVDAIPQRTPRVRAVEK